MAHTTITIKVSVAWWLEPYLYLLAFVCFLTQREPDWAKLSKVIEAAITIRGD